MKKRCLILVFVVTACGGNLSDEQRKKFKEGMEQHKIVRIQEPEIMDASLKKGQQIVKSLESNPSPASIDSTQHVHQVKIHFAVPGEGNALAIEQELIDAYIAGMATGTVQENLQKIYSSTERDRYDTLLYSKPAIVTRPDGTEELKGIWNIYIPKKQIVLDISKSKD
jgi:hypothetical protein